MSSDGPALWEQFKNSFRDQDIEMIMGAYGARDGLVPDHFLNDFHNNLHLVRLEKLGLVVEQDKDKWRLKRNCIVIAMHIDKMRRCE